MHWNLALTIRAELLRRFWRYAGCILGLAACLPLAAQAAAMPPMIDAHAHYTAVDADVLAPSAVVAKLDTAGVTRLVVSGSPPGLGSSG